MKVYTAPELPLVRSGDNTIFLAGSIEMDRAREWQEEIIQKLSFLPDDWIVLNPRRRLWDKTWEQSVKNPYFYQQVDWELTWLDRADYKLFYFQKDTMSPITLMELGAFGGNYGCFIVCEDGYQRKGNVEIFSYKRNIPMYSSLDQVITEFRKTANKI